MTAHRITADRIIAEALGSGVVEQRDLDEISSFVPVDPDEVASACHLGELLNAGHIDTWTLLTLADLGDDDADSIAAEVDRWTVDLDTRAGVLLVSDEGA